jgi:hypothetical protein
MLQTSHEGTRYTPPVLGGRTNGMGTDRSLYRALGLVHEPQQASVEVTREMSDSGDISFDGFLDHYLEARDQLAYRLLRGETLNPRERATLTALNQVAERLLPAPPPMAPEVTALVDEVLRRR